MDGLTTDDPRLPREVLASLERELPPPVLVGVARSPRSKRRSALAHAGHPGRDLGPPLGTETAQDVLDVRCHRLWRDGELGSDLAIRPALGDQPGDLELARGQWRPWLSAELIGVKTPARR